MVSRNRLLLINPRIQPGEGCLEHIRPLMEGRRSVCDVTLPTLAALTPESWDIVLWDEGVEPLGTSLRLDDFQVICLQYDELRLAGTLEQLERLRALPNRVVVVSGMMDEELRPVLKGLADVLLVGEVERIWPQFLQDFESGTWKSEYIEKGMVDLRVVPPPRIDLLPQDAYLAGAIQTSRSAYAPGTGIASHPTFGIHRTKEPGQVVLELVNWSRHGYRMIHLIDDDFFGTPDHARSTLMAIRDWQETRPCGERIALVAQTSLSLANDAALMQLARAANVTEVVITLKDMDSGLPVETRQTDRVNGHLANASAAAPSTLAPLDAVRTLQENGLVVSVRVLLDPQPSSSTVHSRQLTFLQQAGIPGVTIELRPMAIGSLDGRMDALTPGRQRLETRRGGNGADIGVEMAFADTREPAAHTPKRRCLEERRALTDALYRPEKFLERLEILLQRLPPEEGVHVFPAAWQLSAIAATNLSFRDAIPAAQQIRHTIIAATARFPSKAATFSRLLLQFRDAQIMLDASGMDRMAGDRRPIFPLLMDKYTPFAAF